MATVALVGVKGSLGYKVLPALLASDAIKEVHCLSRKTIEDTNPKEKNFKVDYAKPETLEAALKGCDVLINTMGTEGDYESSKHALVDAAANAGVKFYIPRYLPPVESTVNSANLGSMLRSIAKLLITQCGMERRKMTSMRRIRDYMSSQFCISYRL